MALTQARHVPPQDVHRDTPEPPALEKGSEDERWYGHEHGDNGGYFQEACSEDNAEVEVEGKEAVQ